MSKTVNVNFKLDAEDKKRMEIACDEMGLSMSAAFTIFAKTVGREHRIPFEVAADPFYEKGNIDYLERKIKEYRSGILKTEEHELFEDR